MSKKDKLLNKLCMIPSLKDFAWQELLTLMGRFDFKETCSGGSHYMFEHTRGFRFRISKTHSGGILKTYQIRDVKDAIRQIGGIDDQDQ
jgi:hypothetical protein